MLSQDFSEFVALLNQHKVEYLIVGGYAVTVHGYPRYTGDLDVWINSEEDTATKVMQVLEEFGFGALGLQKQDFLEPEAVVQLGYPPVRIDILTYIDGVTFAECYPQKVVLDIEGLSVNFISLPDLLKNKKSSGRTRDLNDLENLSE
ncbi:nucleotidyltransferase [Nibribacter koreensis]|uniref:Nucleotidyl transferase AbiEii/AbiGii toxin family protein n=1 Tax=Nibribacter koreensis TaxID=1084519 RepID=A0ABP8FVF4_9BACT